MPKLGLNSASIDLTQTIWYKTIFSRMLFWWQEEQIRICSFITKLCWRYLWPQGLQLDLFLLLLCSSQDKGCWFLFFEEGTFSRMQSIEWVGANILSTVRSVCEAQAALIRLRQTAWFNLTLYGGRENNRAVHGFMGWEETWLLTLTHSGAILHPPKGHWCKSQGSGWENGKRNTLSDKTQGAFGQREGC